jgi:hypothetical protein
MEKVFLEIKQYLLDEMMRQQGNVGYDDHSGTVETILEKVEEIELKVIENKKDISDGYHTFGELYYHRMMLFNEICKTHKDKAWKSWKHDDGSMFNNSFIVGIETPEGQYTYHYREEYFDLFDVKELEYAPKYDGHKPEDITRLASLNK